MDKELKIYKIGNFYNCYGDNGVLLHYLMGYKFVESRNSCSYPSSAYNKVNSILQIKRISYVIYAKDKVIDSYRGISNKYLEVMDKAKERYRIEQVMGKYKLNSYTIDEIMEVMDKLKK